MATSPRVKKRRERLGEAAETMPFYLDEARDRISRRALHELLDELLDLRHRSSPDRCADPATLALNDGELREWEEIGKHAAARRAVFLMKMLTVGAAGWAINHLIGWALLWLPPDGIDTHEVELIGTAIDVLRDQSDKPCREDFKKLAIQQICEAGPSEQLAQSLTDEIWETANDPQTTRRVLLAMLDWTLLPSSIHLEFEETLSALFVGDVKGLFRPKTVGRKGSSPYTLVTLKTKLLEYVYYCRGKGVPVARTIHDVSSALLRSPETIKSWIERDLLKDIGRYEITKIRDRALLIGELFVQYKMHGLVPEGGEDIEIEPPGEAAELEALDFRKLREELNRAETPLKQRRRGKVGKNQVQIS